MEQEEERVNQMEQEEGERLYLFVWSMLEERVNQMEQEEGERLYLFVWSMLEEELIRWSRRRKE